MAKIISKAEFDLMNAALNQAKYAYNSATTDEERAKAKAWIDKLVYGDKGESTQRKDEGNM